MPFLPVHEVRMELVSKTYHANPNRSETYVQLTYNERPGVGSVRYEVKVPMDDEWQYQLGDSFMLTVPEYPYEISLEVRH